MLRRVSKVETSPLASGCPLPSYIIDVCLCDDPLYKCANPFARALTLFASLLIPLDLTPNILE